LSAISSDLSTEITSDDPLKELRQCSGMPTPIQKAENKAAGNRLRLFRFALAEFREDFSLRTLRTFANTTKEKDNNMNNWELGRSLVPNHYIQRLKEQYGVSYLFEWIYGADDSGLPGRLSAEIKRLARPTIVEAKTAPQRRRRKIA